MNLAEFLLTSAARHAAAPAAHRRALGAILSYGAARPRGRAGRRVPRPQGVEPGQRIGLLAPNDLTTCRRPSAARRRRVPGPARHATSPRPRWREILARSQRQRLPLVARGGALPGAPGRGDAARGGACDGFAFQWIDRGAEAPAGVRALNPAFIRFTSGTTARSKGVVLSHEATAARVEAADRVLKFSEDDRILWVLPLAYHFAVTIVAYVRAGSHILMCPDTLPRAHGRRDPAASAPTVLYAVAAPLRAPGHLGPSPPLPSMRLALSTSAPITAAVMDRFESVYGVPVGQAYGIIEAGLPCINLGTEGLPPASVGRPVPGYDVAVFSDEGERLPAEALGEIGVRGDGLFSAYYAPWPLREQVDATAGSSPATSAGSTPAGALHLKGRKKAVIFVAGLKFFPEEVEDCINQFPGVRESRVFGRPHPHLGEVPCAEIVVEPAGCDLEP